MVGRALALGVAAALALACAAAPEPASTCPEGPHRKLTFTVDPPGDPVQVVRALDQRLGQLGGGCVSVVDGAVVVEVPGGDEGLPTELATPAQLRIAAVAPTGVLMTWYDAVLGAPGVREAPGIARMPYAGAASAVIQQGDATELRAGVAAVGAPEGTEVAWQRVSTDGALWWQPVPIVLAGSIPGERVADAVAALDGGVGVVQLMLDEQGTRDLFAITGSNYGRPLAIVLDGEVVISPLVRGAISDGRASIALTDPERAAPLAALLRAGALPAPIHLAASEIVP